MKMRLSSSPGSSPGPRPRVVGPSFIQPLKPSQRKPKEEKKKENSNGYCEYGELVSHMTYLAVLQGIDLLASQSQVLRVSAST